MILFLRKFIDAFCFFLKKRVFFFKKEEHELKETYNPFANYQDLLTTTGLIKGLAPAINNFQIVSGKTISGTSTGTETTQVTNNQQQQHLQIVCIFLFHRFLK